MSDWTDRATRAPAAIIDPYEDFETAIRSGDSDPGELWHPVYVRLRAGVGGTTGYTAAAERLQDVQAHRPRRLAMGRDSLARLNRMITQESASGTAGPDHLRYLFVYRRTDRAYDPVTTPQDQGGEDVYEVVQVGVAVPRAVVDDTPLSPGDAAPVAPTLRPDIVVTAVIDDFLGVAHERFQSAQGTRIRHHWVQGIERIDPARGGAPTVAIGQEFDADDIDALRAAAPSEPAFYRNMRAAMRDRAGAGQGPLIAALRDRFDRARAAVAAGDTETVAAALKSAQDVVTDRVARLAPIATEAATRVADTARQVFGALTDDTDPDTAFAPLANAVAREPDLKFEERDYRRPIGFSETHGTHTLDLAGGAPLGSLGRDDRPLVCVELPALATIETNGARLDSFVVQAVHRVLDWCDTWTLDDSSTARVGVVINLSYGISAGPKTGRGFLEREIARALDARNREGLPSKAVLPAGNTYRSHLTGAMSVPQGQSRSIDWRVLPQDFSSSYLELTLPGAAAATLTLTPPQGAPETVVLPDPGDGLVREWRSGNRVIGAIYAQPSPTEAGMTRVTLALAPTDAPQTDRRAAPAGAYRVSLANTATGPDAVALEATLDVQRDDTPSGFPIFGRQSYLEDAAIGAVDPVTRDYAAPGPGSAVRWDGTLSAYATSSSDHMFTVAGTYPDGRGANATRDSRDPARYSSSGPSRGALPRNPDLAAITEQGRAIEGHLAAGTFSGATAVFSGTSSAAPQVTRAIVDVLAAAGGPLDKADILTAILGAPPGGADARLGHGLPRRTYQAGGRVARR